VAHLEKHPWNTPLRSLLLLILVLGLFTVINFIGSGETAMAEMPERSPLDVIAATVLMSMMLASVVLFGVYACGQSLGELGLRFNQPLKDILWGLPPALLLVVVITLLTPLLDSAIGFNPEATSMFAASFKGCTGWGQALVVSAFIAISASVIEETFRVFVITRVENIEPGRTGTWLGVTLSALAFSMMHGYNGPAMILVSLVAGFGFAWWYAWRRNVLTLMALHFFYDFILLAAFTHGLAYGRIALPGGGTLV